jgi:hypothetical protein
MKTDTEIQKKFDSFYLLEKLRNKLPGSWQVNLS